MIMDEQALAALKAGDWVVVKGRYQPHIHEVQKVTATQIVLDGFGSTERFDRKTGQKRGGSSYYWAYIIGLATPATIVKAKAFRAVREAEKAESLRWDKIAQDGTEAIRRFFPSGLEAKIIRWSIKDGQPIFKLEAPELTEIDVQSLIEHVELA